MEFSQKLDRELCQKDSNVLSVLENGERIVLSSTVWKFSAYNKQQKRIILITNRNLYNITPQSTLANIFSKVVSSLRIKRKIPLADISAVTISRFGYEFVLHVPTQYDYRYSSLDFRDKILEVLADCSFVLLQRKLSFYLTDELNLNQYLTTKADIKKGLSKIPQDLKPMLLDGKEIKEYDFGKYNNTMIQTTKKVHTQCSVSIQDFKRINLIGMGKMGQILLVEHKTDGQLYAVKVLIKQQIIQTDHLVNVKTERRLLEEFHHPNLIYLEWAFHDEERIFFVLPFIQGGDLYFHLRKEKRFKESRVKFYAAQLVLLLQYFHEKDYIYRDLKPENILIDADGYLVVTDYGIAKQMQSGSTNSFVGTLDYLAPEIIQSSGHNRMVDWWTLGIVIYEMLIGITPFYSENHAQLLEGIQEKEPKFPNALQISNEGKDIILQVIQLLKKDAKERLGHKKGGECVKCHPWFANINWKEILERRVPSPFRPTIEDPYDVSNFDLSQFNEAIDILQPMNSDKSLLQKFEDDFFYINYDPINKRQSTMTNQQQT